MSKERVVIIGGGVAGLATALALKRHDCEVVVVERDPAPPEIDALAAFEDWSRPGVPHFRHAHILLARLRTIVRDHHPELADELVAAGFECSKLSDWFPAVHLDSLKPRPEDDDLLHFLGRRATFEYVLRKHVGRLPHVRFVHDARVEGLLTESDARRLHVRGIELTRSDKREVLAADVVIDASGKSTKAPEWLKERGVKIAVESHPSGYVYSCRHFRLQDPLAAPPHSEGRGNLDYLGYATFWGEHGHYSITFCCEVEENAIAETMRRAGGFDSLCGHFPELERWTRESEVRSKVLGSGRFENRWTSYGARGGLELLGFFPVGDSLLETNPMYGRGCSSAFVQAQLLAEVFGAIRDPQQRTRRYHARARQLLRPYFEFSVRTDRINHIRGQRSRGQSLPLGARFFNHLYEAGFMPATEASPLVAREFVKAQQMREISSFPTRLALAFLLVYTLIRSWFGLGPRATGAVGPTRAELLASPVERPKVSPESVERPKVSAESAE